MELAIVKGARRSPVCVCAKNIKGLSQILKWMILMWHWRGLKGKETLRIDRGGTILICHPQLLPLYLFVCLSVAFCLSDSLIWFPYFLLSPLPCLSFFPSVTLSYARAQTRTHIYTRSLFSSLFLLSWSPLMEERTIPLSLLMRNGKQSPRLALTGTLTQITKPRG